jgi:hypothetical protein
MGLNNQEAREYNISRFAIYSNVNGKSCDVNRGFINLHYYESVLENYIKASVLIADTGYSVDDGDKLVSLIDGLDLCGGERVELKIEDGYGNVLDFSNEKSLYIGRIRNKIEHTQNMIFVVDLVTKEFFTNELVETRVDKRFNGKISDSVLDILINFLNTEKNLDIEQTENEYSFNGHVEKPFYKCTWLGKRSIPLGGREKSAGFFFFETYDGFHFKSIEKLLDENRQYRKYIYNNTTELPVGYDGKILEAIPSINIDVHQKMMVGAYGSDVRTYNFFDTNYEEKELKVNRDGDTGINLAGNNLPYLPDDLFGKPTRIISKIQPIGILQKIDKDNSKKKDYDVNEIVAQAASRYNQLFTIILTITIAGDLSHRAGDLIYCDFPELSSGNTQIVSGKNSGLYMIVNATQFIDARDGAFTKLTLARDSYGRKPFRR